MPIYAYKCDRCGHVKDVLQRISDAPLTVCPACNASAFAKQITAAGFQLKGTGWYATDFRGGGSRKPDTDKAADAKPEKAAESGSAATTAGADSKPSAPAAAGSDGGTDKSASSAAS